LTSGFVGSAYVGLESNRKLNLGFKKFVYCIGLDSYKNIFNKISKNAFVIAQTPFSDNLLKRVDLILPSTSFLEKEATFINLEGRVQKTAISLKAPNLARDDVKILQTIFTSNLKKSNKFVFSHFDNNKICFTKNLKVNLVSKKFFKSSFKSSFSNFFITNAITKNSVVMAKCFLTFKQNYKNFIL
jgi:NADH-quinone oxidoreductase subunit G